MMIKLIPSTFMVRYCNLQVFCHEFVLSKVERPRLGFGEQLHEGQISSMTYKKVFTIQKSVKKVILVLV